MQVIVRYEVDEAGKEQGASAVASWTGRRNRVFLLENNMNGDRINLACILLIRKKNCHRAPGETKSMPYPPSPQYSGVNELYKSKWIRVKGQMSR